jgi:hypothetical protein
VLRLTPCALRFKVGNLCYALCTMQEFGGAHASDCISRRSKSCPERRVEYLRYAVGSGIRSNRMSFNWVDNSAIRIWHAPEKLKGEGG